MITFRDLLTMLSDPRLLATGSGWVLSNYAEQWAWYQGQPENRRRGLMFVFCVLLAAGFTGIKAIFYGADMPIEDQLTNMVVSFFMSYFTTQLNYTRLKANEEKAVVEKAEERLVVEEVVDVVVEEAVEEAVDVAVEEAVDVAVEKAVDEALDKKA